jgi:hypothetical protein
MDNVIALLAFVAVAASMGLAGSLAMGRASEMFVGLFSPYRGLEWPRGVQEEDPPTGWSWHPPEAGASGAPDSSGSVRPPRLAPEPDATPQSFGTGGQPGGVVPVQPIRGHVRRGTNRVYSRW